MNETSRCPVCDSRLPLGADPCDRCGARYCSDHRTGHPCGVWFKPWRQLAAALAEQTIEYPSRNPIALRLFRGTLRYWPAARLLTVAGVSSVRACHDAFRGVTRHSQEVADQLVAVLRMPPLAAVRVEIELAGEDGMVTASEGLIAGAGAR
jgi:hypothetical protein